jgi:hypothetical protein
MAARWGLKREEYPEICQRLHTLYRDLNRLVTVAGEPSGAKAHDRGLEAYQNIHLAYVNFRDDAYEAGYVPSSQPDPPWQRTKLQWRNELREAAGLAPFSEDDWFKGRRPRSGAPRLEAAEHATISADLLLIHNEVYELLDRLAGSTARWPWRLDRLRRCFTCLELFGRALRTMQLHDRPELPSHYEWAD